MKLRFDMVLTDYQDYDCDMCEETSNPIYRFFYATEKEDLNGNAIAELEVSVCRKCASKLERGWKKKLEDVCLIHR